MLFNGAFYPVLTTYHIQTEVEQNTYGLSWNGLKSVLKMSGMRYIQNMLGVKNRIQADQETMQDEVQRIVK